MRRWLLIAVGSAGCPVDGKDQDPPADTDTDTDTDADSDSDADTDSDGTLSATGTWFGDCVQEAAGTTTLGYHVELDLVDDAGALEGRLTLVKYYSDGPATLPYGDAPVSGTRDGAVVVLPVDFEPGYPFARFDLTLDGDTMTGGIELLPDSYAQLTLPCELVR